MGGKMEKMDSEMKEGVKTMFKEYDTDGDGYIDIKQVEESIRKMCEGHVGPEWGVTDDTIREKAEEFIKEIDKNGDGKISYKEYHNYVAGILNGGDKK